MRESAQQEEGGHNPGHWGRASLGRRKEKTDCEHPTMFPVVTHGTSVPSEATETLLYATSQTLSALSLKPKEVHV